MMPTTLSEIKKPVFVLWVFHRRVVRRHEKRKKLVHDEPNHHPSEPETIVTVKKKKKRILVSLLVTTSTTAYVCVSTILGIPESQVYPVFLLSRFFQSFLKTNQKFEYLWEFFLRNKSGEEQQQTKFSYLIITTTTKESSWKLHTEYDFLSLSIHYLVFI